MANAAAHSGILQGADAADTLLEFARARGVTQLFLGTASGEALARLTGGPLDKLISKAAHGRLLVPPQQSDGT